MKKEYTFDELLHKAASYCSISEHSILEVREKLARWDVPEADAEKIIQHLVEDDFIHEIRFSKAYVRDKFRLNKWGKTKISVALKSKGISDEMVRQALKSIDQGEYEEMLGSILKSKLKTLKYDYEYEKQGKLFKFAQSRGFESDVIERVMRGM